VYGLRVAREVLGRKKLPVKVVFNCDEETGSRDSRPLIERLMPRAKAAFIFEGRRKADNALVTSRKGIMMGRMTVTGRAAHAGEAPQNGSNAIVEAAHKIIALAGLTRLEKGLVVTTGRIRGGEVDNQIPDYCDSGIDIRFRSPRQGEEIRAAVQAIMERVHVPGCATEFSLQTVRPPFQKSEAGEALRGKFSQFAAEFGVNLAEKEAGGGSDGNLTAALGVPTLDGMGPAGDHAHTHQEYILASSFFNAIMTFALFFASELDA
jgi:glutamate carboxypeptidase